MFTGNYTRTIDSKGRLSVPSHWMKDLGLSFTLLRGVEPCLIALPNDHWAHCQRRYWGNPTFTGYYLSSAVERPIHLPSQRFIIPVELRGHAGLTLRDEAVLVGIGKAILVVSHDVWQKQLKARRFPELERLCREIPELGLVPAGGRARRGVKGNVNSHYP